MNRWKEKNGNSYDAFLKYREDAIKRAYDGGIKMCEQYANKKIYKTKKINIKNIGDYFKILSGKNQGKKMIREIALFHFPIFSYLKYRY